MSCMLGKRSPNWATSLPSQTWERVTVTQSHSIFGQESKYSMTRILQDEGERPQLRTLVGEIQTIRLGSKLLHCSLLVVKICYDILLTASQILNLLGVFSWVFFLDSIEEDLWTLSLFSNNSIVLDLTHWLNSVSLPTFAYLYLTLFSWTYKSYLFQ